MLAQILRKNLLKFWFFLRFSVQKQLTNGVSLCVCVCVCVCVRDGGKAEVVAREFVHEHSTFESEIYQAICC